jgi:glycerol-3-phosphate acyltransferase PlsY
MTIGLIVVALIVSYLIGSVPTAYIVARLRKGIDIREVGSRNMGAMNVIYSVGLIEGIFVLVVDIGKGSLAVFLASVLTVSLESTFIIQLAAGVVVILGHSYTVFLNFRGGKGGATCIGVLVYLIYRPWSSPIYLGLFLLLLLITRAPTISYSLAFVSFPFMAGFLIQEHSILLVVYSIVILVIPGLMYIPRIKEMYSRGGSWKRVLFRSSVKERF